MSRNEATIRPTTIGLTASLLLLAALNSPAWSQKCEWFNASSPGPSGRAYTALAHDRMRGATVLFGGSDGYLNSGDTWEHREGLWTQVAADGPTARRGHAMVYDIRRGVTVLFGGTDDSGACQDTWEWNGSTWIRVAETGPSPRTRHAMAYDRARGVTVLFGGSFDSHSVGETWEWDGAAWTQVSNTGPSARSAHAMTYNPDRGVVVLFGGNASASYRDDLWEWDGVNWTRIADGGPEARYSHGLAYDEEHGGLVLFGGWGRYTGNQRDTWVWNGVAWRRVLTRPPAGTARYAHAMTYDSTRQAIMMFGGLLNYRPDTWYFECKDLRMAVNASCPGGGAMRIGWTGATPRAHVAVLFAPRSGRTFVPPGNRCEGTLLGLAGGIQFIARGTTHSSGRGSITGVAGPEFCGGRMQLLDLMFCATSNVVPVE